MAIWGTYESEEHKLIARKEEEMMMLDELYDGDYEYEDGEYLDCEECEDYPDDYWYEDQDALEIGFDPYMGCYSDDC